MATSASLTHPHPTSVDTEIESETAIMAAIPAIATLTDGETAP